MILPLTFRCSSLDQLFSCNGSFVAQSLVPRRPSSEGAEGSLIHYLIAKRLVVEHGATEPEGGLKYPDLPKGYVLPAFSAWLVDFGVRYARDVIPPDWSLIVEQGLAYRLDLPEPVWVPVTEIEGPIPPEFVIRAGPVNEVCIDHVIISGHIDVMGISPDGKQSRGIDWKSVIVAVEPAESNWQAASYIRLQHAAWGVEEATFDIVQPRIDEEATGIPRVSSTTLKGAELQAMARVLARQVNNAIINRFETDSGMKQCRYCSVALSRPWLCPSIKLEESTMKATLTPSTLAALREKPNDALLGDFVISGNILTEPMKAAKEMLNERLDVVSYIDAACGIRITRTLRPGQYEVPDPMAFEQAVQKTLPDEGRRVLCRSYSMDDLRKQIAAHRDIPQKSTKKDVLDAKKVFDAELRPLTVQKDSRILVYT